MPIRLAVLALASLFCIASPVSLNASSAAATATTAATTAATAPANRAPRPAITLVNLNTADAATLARDMDGIGATKAQAIIDHRKANGPFRAVDELALVKGIGKKTLERNRARLTVGSPPSSAAPRAPRGAAAALGNASSR